MEFDNLNLIWQVEEYVKRIISKAEQTGNSLISRDYKHVTRVRNWAVRIAEREGFQDLEIVEIAALFHNIGLYFLKKNDNINKHSEVGMKIATKFLMEKSSLPKDKIKDIATAVRYHSSSQATVLSIIGKDSEHGTLLKIIRDADIIDAIGAIGLMRAISSKAALPEYNPQNIKGDTWGLSSKQFNERFKEKQGTHKYIIDQINLQISYYDNLLSESGKYFAKPLMRYMKEFIISLENEIDYRNNSN